MKKILLAAVVTAFILSGCNIRATQNDLSGLHFVKADEKIGDKTQEERAEAIKKRLGQIKGISGNAVVVEGYTAIIGLRLEEDEKDTSYITKEAETAAREADEYLESASITTNRRIVALIEELERKRAG